MHLLPHGLSQAMLDPSKKITSPKIKKILDIKTKNDAKLCLFFLLHSDYRKGADIAIEAFQFVQQMFNDLYLVVKKGSGDTDTNKNMRSLRLIEVPGWLSEEELRQLYDVCDILIVPSRGGGFELNALEGIARGIPTIVPDAGCFKDYSQYCIPLPVVNHPKLFPDNPIHVGNGWEISAEALAKTIALLHEAPERFSGKLQESSEAVRETYAWSRIGERLYDLLNQYGFVDDT